MRAFRLYWYPSILSMISGLAIWWFGGDPERANPIHPIVLTLVAIVVMFIVFIAVFAHMKEIEDNR